MSLHARPEKPNLPEVTGSAIPLISTVLAGFAVTVIVQIIGQPEIRAGSVPFWSPIMVSLICMVFSVPLLLTATIFAIWGQSYNYLNLSQEVRTMLNIPDPVWTNYLRTTHKKWRLWHGLAAWVYHIGTLAFVAGTGMLLLANAGGVISVIFLILSVASLGATVILSVVINRMT